MHISEYITTERTNEIEGLAIERDKFIDIRHLQINTVVHLAVIVVVVVVVVVVVIVVVVVVVVVILFIFLKYKMVVIFCTSHYYQYPVISIGFFTHVKALRLYHAG